jgi:hypothetical protein
VNQDLLLAWFQKRRKSGDETFISVPELEEAFFKEGNYNGNLKNVRGLVNKLYAWGFLEIENFNTYRRAYRCKIKVLDMDLISPLNKDISAEDQGRLT